MIYQLYNTSVGLGGQCKLDLILNHKNNLGCFELDDMYLTPISEQIPFNETSGWNTINYSHLYNIKHLYKQISEYFYIPVQRFNQKSYIYNPYNYNNIDTFDHTYEYGCQRNRYEKYNKQFSIFVPMWISEGDFDFSELEFRLYIKGIGKTEGWNVERRLKLNKSYIKYFKDYIKDIELNDYLLNLKIDTYNAFVYGIEIENVKSNVKDITYIYKDIFYRETTVLDFDRKLLRVFENNKMIARQLFNFNINFNIEDLVSFDPSYALNDNDFEIWCDIYYKDNITEKKSFYTNYENIPGYTIIGDDVIRDYNINVLDYLEDYKSLDNIYENKLVQNVFHWGLLDNKDYIVNMYNGFSPTKDGYLMTNLMSNQCNLSKNTYDEEHNNLGWCKHYNYSLATNPSHIISLVHELQNRFIDGEDVMTTVNTNSNNIWINSNKFEGGLNLKNFIKVNIATILVGSTNLDDIIPINGDGLEKYINSNSNILVLKWEYNHVLNIFIISKNKDFLTVKSINEKISRSFVHESSPTNSDKIIRDLINILGYWIPPYQIQLKHSIVGISVTTPNEANEKVFYELDQNIVLNRYFGNIIPAFRDNYYNINYYYKQFQDEKDPKIIKYKEFILKGLVPEYPSIGMFALGYHSNLSNIPGIYGDDYEWEYKWYDKSKVKILPYIVTKELEVDKNLYNNEEIERMLWDILKNCFVYPWDNRDKIDEYFNLRIRPLYKRKVNFEYKSLTNINTVIYKVVFKLY